MKKIYLACGVLLAAFQLQAQNPGLVISEFLANPQGNDNSLEWIELVATKPIDFSVTPYAVVVCNNGTANANGWVSGGSLSYGFAITTGVVNTGDVVYVGGSAMAPTGTKIRTIDAQTTPGDGFGNAGGTAGVVGNGGGNMDGIAVFNQPIASLTNSTVPVDAIFYGTGVGSALVNGGADGYQLPVNDRYNGGKLQSTTSFVDDPGGDISVRATGYYNIVTNSWSGLRSWSVQTPTNNNATLLQLVTVDPPGMATIGTATQTINESTGTVNVNVTFANANNNVAKIAFSLSTYTNATQGSDFSWASDTLVIPANSNGTFPFTIQLTDDLLAERTERIIVKMTGAVNANIGAANYQLIYLNDNDYQAPVANNELQMQMLSSFNNGAEGTNSAEIVDYDPTTERLYIVNSIGKKLDIVDFSDPSAPELVSSNSITSYGNINSLTVHNGIVAVAMENADPQANGFVVFFDEDGDYINQVTVGAMPDMITFNNDYTKLVVACEGEPKSDYSVDPAGTVAIIDLAPGIPALTNANVAIADFSAWNGQEAALRAQGIRIFGPGSNVSQDFEPEYVTISEDNQTAYVALQENNAMAVINLNTATVTAVRPLGFMDYSTDNGMDASDQTSGVLITSVPVKGVFMPDALAHATIGGTEYIFSANEGDAREYTAITDVARVSATNLDPTAFPDQAILKNNQFLGRLNVLQATGDTDGDGDKDELHVLGTRSFSIWNAATGALVFDSKDWLERITSTHPTLSGLFNASNGSGTSQMKNRSDDKGPEPEGISTAVINGNHYLFVSLERVGGVLIFNIDNPTAPVYSGYYNNRSIGANSGPDRGAEGIIYIPKEESPNNKDLVILANEISSTLSVYQVNTCVELSGATITATQDSICAGDTTELSVPGHVGSTLQWYYNDQPVNTATGTTLGASEAGDYRVFVSNTTFGCADTTIATTITVHSLPNVGAGADQSICAGTSVTLSGAGAQAYEWSGGIEDNTAFEPVATTDYIVTGADINGCENTDTVTVTVNPLPVVAAGDDQEICAGASVTLAGSGADAYDWNNDVGNNIAFQPAATTDYIVTGTDTNECSNTDTVTVTVNTLPTVLAGDDATVCATESVTFTASGAETFDWNNGIANGAAFEATISQTYIVTGTDTNGCESTDTLELTVNALPVPQLGSADTTVCTYDVPVTFNAGSGFVDYDWSTGAASQTISVSAAGTYDVTVTDANGCEGSDEITLILDPCLGIAEQTAELTLFPNPTDGWLNIQSNNAAPLQVEVRTLTGQQLLSTNEPNVDLTALASGVYFVRVKQGVTDQLFRVEKH